MNSTRFTFRAPSTTALLVAAMAVGTLLALPGQSAAQAPTPAPVTAPAPDSAVPMDEPTADEVAEATSFVPLGTDRTLNGHAFVQSQIVRFPFVTTSFGSATGFGTVDFDVQFTDGVVKTSMAAITEQFDASLAFTDFLSIDLNATGLVAVGTDNQSALISGAIFSGSFGGGVVGRLVETDTVYVSARLGGTYGINNLISPLQFVNEAIDQGTINSDTLLVNSSNWTITPSGAVAWAPAPYFGAQASLGLEFGAFKNEGMDSESSTELNFAAALTFDANSFSVPVAVLFAYGIDAPLSGGGDPAHNIEAGLYYSELQYLNLGAVFGTSFGGDEEIISGQLRLTHYW